MKFLIALSLALLFVGCAATDSPPANDINDTHAQVSQADRDWEAYVKTGATTKEERSLVAKMRHGYEEATHAGNDVLIRDSARNYTDLVYEIMMPPLHPPPKKK